jgi:ribosomal protein S18 acetylase RimI-like enzyme
VELTASFRVRRATVTDASRLARVGATLFAQAFAARNRPDDMVTYLADAFGEPQQARELVDNTNLIWIAEDDQANPIGYAQIRLHSRPKALTVGQAAELARMYADQSWHGRGVGAELLRTCIDAAMKSGAEVLWLGVWKENPRGIAFYEKHGFRIAGEQTFRLGSDPQHDWIMVRELDPRAAASS